MSDSLQENTGKRSTKENIVAFILELEALSRKYGVTIGGCGCCGSPSVSLPEDGSMDDDESGYIADMSENEASDLNWLSRKSTIWDKKSKNMVKNMRNMVKNMREEK